MVALTVFDDGRGPALYAGGVFATAGAVSANSIATWTGSSWAALGLGSGANGLVSALTVFDDGGGSALYAGGGFASAGGVNASYIAQWDGASWSALGSGMGDNTSPYVSALTVFDDGGGPALYAAGLFTTAGGVSANRIAKWDGSSWSALGSGLNHWVSALVVFDDGAGPALYAGGFFTTAGGVTANRIAKWNPGAPGSWSALGSGLEGTSRVEVKALAVFDDGGGPALYAGGEFTTAGGVRAISLAKWDGASWSAVGSGMSDVFALTVFDNGGGPALYAGGAFDTAGGVGANRIAKWDGASWSALGSGMNTYVRAMTVFDDGGGPALYAGGYFSTAGGVSANRIARWDGASWSALESGIDGSVDALVAFDSGAGPTLYAGGSFTTAGGVVSAYFAEWRCAATCKPADCNGHGTCKGRTCYCDEGYGGAGCGECAEQHFGYPECTYCDAATTCFGHGRCSRQGGCMCNPGWSGPNCEQRSRRLDRDPR